ncbi:MAG: hypothetical protein AAFP77_16045 [Bacteroidota bacterium]
MNRIVSEAERVLFTSGGLLPAFIDRVPNVAAGRWRLLADSVVVKALFPFGAQEFKPGGIVAGTTLGQSLEQGEYVVPIDVRAPKIAGVTAEEFVERMKEVSKLIPKASGVVGQPEDRKGEGGVNL